MQTSTAAAGTALAAAHSSLQAAPAPQGALPTGAVEVDRFDRWCDRARRNTIRCSFLASLWRGWRSDGLSAVDALAEARADVARSREGLS